MPNEVTLIWRWPDTLLLILVTLAIAGTCRLLITLAVRQTVKLARRRATDHRTAPGRAGRLLAATGMDLARSEQRAATMGSILTSLADFVIVLVALLTILGALGLPLAPLLASAGVGGIALGFGAQSLVKDFLSGVFMIIEDQYGVGDFIDTGEVSGTVEEVSLRVTRLRDPSGLVWYVRNGEISRVGNHSQGWSTAMIDIPVAYDEDEAKVLGVLGQVVEGIDLDQEWARPLIEKPTVLGVDSVTGATMTVRMMIKTQPNQHYGPARELRARAKQALGAAGIRGPAVFGG